MATTNLVIPVHAAFQAKGSLKAIEEGIKNTLIQVSVMRVRGDSKTHLHLPQVSLCPLQVGLTRGNRTTPYSPTVRVQKGDWIVHTPFGGLVLSPEEYDQLAEAA